MGNQKRRTQAAKAIVAVFAATFVVVVLGCAMPEAVKVELGTVKDNLNRLKKIVDNKADQSIVAEQIDKVYSNIEQNTKLIEKTYNADVIKFSGAGWVVLGACLIIIIFLGAFGLLIRMLLKRVNLLKLVTCAISKVPPNVGRIVKNKIESEIQMGELNGGPFTNKHKRALEDFTKKHGTFAQDPVED